MAEDEILRLEGGVPRVRTIEDNLHAYTNTASAVAVGDVVAQDASVDDKAIIADADTGATIPPIGMVVTVTDSTNCVVCHSGGIATGLSALTRGSSYWLTTTGTTGNTLTVTKPASNAYLVGVALSATTMMISTFPADVTGGGAGLTQTNAVYVSKAGDDSDDGTDATAPKLTIGSAITQAGTMSPAVTKRISIIVQDAGIYAEDSLSFASYIDFYAPHATMEHGDVAAAPIFSLAGDSGQRAHVYKLSAGGTGVHSGVNVTATTDAHLRVDELEVLTTSGAAYGVRIGGARRAIVSIGKLTVVNSVGLERQNVGSGNFTAEVNEIEITGTGTGVYTYSAAVATNLRIGRIFDAGSGTGIQVQGGGSSIVSAYVGELNCNTTYTVAASTTLNLFVGELTGTPGAVSGTLNLSEAGQAGDVSAAAVIADHTIVRGDGGSKGVQDSGILIDDLDNVSDAISFQMLEQASAPVTPAAGDGLFWVKSATGINFPYFTDDNDLDQELVRSVVLERSMPASAGSSVELGSFTGVNRGTTFSVYIWSSPTTSIDFSAYHRVVVQVTSTGGWVIHRAEQTSMADFGAFTDNQQLEINNGAVAGTLALRLRSYGGSAVTVGVRIVCDGNEVAIFTPTSTEAVTTAATGRGGYAMLTQTGNVNGASPSVGVIAWEPMYFAERAAAHVDKAAFGQLWVQNLVPTALMFTSDTGVDKYVLSNNNAPVDNALVRFIGVTGTTETSGVLIDDNDYVEAAGFTAAERGTAPTPAAAEGVFWVENLAPTVPRFSDDVSDDHYLVMSAYHNEVTTATSTASAAKYSVFDEDNYSAYTSNENASRGITYNSTTGRFSFTNAGTYRINTSLTLQTSGTVDITISADLSGVEKYTTDIEINNNAAPLNQSFEIILVVTAAQYIEIWVDSASATTLQCFGGCSIAISRVG